MLTDKDYEILEFVKQYGGITINQCKSLFYNTKYGYDTAKRRLRALHQEGYLKADRDFLSNKIIYYNYKKLSSHSILLLDFYSRLIGEGAEVVLFKREFKTPGARADGFVIFKYKNTAKMLLVEVDINNRTKIDKYKRCYEEGYFQKQFGAFPVVMIVEKKKKEKEKKEGNKEIKYKVVKMDYSYSDLSVII